MAVPIEPEKCQSCDRFLTKHIKRTPSISTAASIPDQKLTEEEIIEKKLFLSFDATQEKFPIHYFQKTRDIR